MRRVQRRAHSRAHSVSSNTRSRSSRRLPQLGFVPQDAATPLAVQSSRQGSRSSSKSSRHSRLPSLVHGGGATTQSLSERTPLGDAFTTMSAASHRGSGGGGPSAAGSHRDGITTTSAASPSARERARAPPEGLTLSTAPGAGRVPSDIMATRPAEQHAHASAKERAVRLVARVEDALDRMGEREARFAGRYVVLGALERRSGGQGVVQFMRGLEDERDYAAKVRARLHHTLGSSRAQL
jgi:hypothetical protein